MKNFIIESGLIQRQERFMRLCKYAVNLSSPSENRIWIFIHVGKSGGSSFWHSLAKSGTKSGIKILDAYHKSTIDYGNPDHQAESLNLLLDEVRRKHLFPVERSFIHYHSDHRIHIDVSDVFFVLLVREAGQRAPRYFVWVMV